MPYLKAILQRRSDNVAPNATLTLSGATLATDYPITNFVDEDPSKPGKLNETTGAIIFDFAAAQRQEGVALIHANLAAGLDVAFQCNASNVWTSPSVNVAFTIPAYKANKYPTNVYVDLTTSTGFLTAGFRYGRFIVLSPNPVPIAIGEIVIISQKREIEWLANTQLYRDHRMIVDHTTDAGVTSVFDLGVTVRSFEGRVTNRPTQKIALDEHWADVRGRSFPFLFIPNALGDREPWLVRWDEPIKEENFLVPNISTLTLKMRETSRGLYPTPSAV